MNNLTRHHGLEAAGMTPRGGGRRKVEREDVDFAVANRPRMGWQTIANIRGVNELDLRTAAETATSSVAAGRPRPAPRPAPVVAEVTPPTPAKPAKAAKPVKPAKPPKPPKPPKAVRPPKAPKPPKPERKPLRQIQVLQAIRAKAQTHYEIAAQASITARNSVTVLFILRSKGLVEDQPRPAKGWRLTDAGVAQLATWEAAFG